MQFHERTSYVDVYKKLGLMPPHFGPPEMKAAYETGLMPHIAAAQCIDEAYWIEGRRPYYNVWPAILQSLVRTPLDLPGDAVHLPRDPLLVRFAVGGELTHGALAARSLLVSETLISDLPGNVRGLVLWVDHGETGDFAGVRLPLFTYRVFQLDGKTVEQALEDSKKQHDPITAAEEELMVQCIRVVLATCLLGEDSELFEPDVLGKDAAAYADNPRPEIVDRAHRRGKVGWHVGRATENVPHIRRPHFAIRWMGHGDAKEPRLRPIKGSVVMRKRLTDVPTGYLDDETI